MWFIIIAIVLIIGAVLWAMSGPDCPRMILGYKCKGRDCDHSPEAIREARRSMR
jgi:hypothetical protein